MPRLAPVISTWALVLASVVTAQVFTPGTAPVRRPAAKPRPQAPAPRPISRELVQVPKPAAARTAWTLRELGGIDTYVRSSVPGASWGGEGSVNIGGWGDTYVGLFWFDVSDVPELRPDQALALRLYVKAPDSGSSHTTSFHAYRAADVVSNAATWKSAPRFDNTSGQTVNVPGTEQWVLINLSSYLDHWRAGNANNGIILIPDRKDNAFDLFVSSNDASRPTQQPVIQIVPRSLFGAAADPRINAGYLDSPVRRAVTGQWKTTIDAGGLPAEVTMAINLVNLDQGGTGGVIRFSKPGDNGGCSMMLRLSGISGFGDDQSVQLDMVHDAQHACMANPWSLRVWPSRNGLRTVWFDPSGRRGESRVDFGRQ